MKARLLENLKYFFKLTAGIPEYSLALSDIMAAISIMEPKALIRWREEHPEERLKQAQEAAARWREKHPEELKRIQELAKKASARCRENHPEDDAANSNG